MFKFFICIFFIHLFSTLFCNPNISENDYKFILNDSTAKIIVVGNEELGQKINNVKAEVPTLEHLMTFDVLDGFVHWSVLEEAASKTEEDEVKNRMAEVK